MNISEEFKNLILECELLDRCGEVEDLGFDVEYVYSEKNAIKLINSIKWEKICIEEQGIFTEFLSKNFKDLYNKNWNIMVRQIKAQYMNGIEKKVNKNWKDEKTKKQVLNDIQFNMITLFMLNFYSEYYKSEFFEKMLRIYLSGHLPCGWSDENKKGKFIVY